MTTGEAAARWRSGISLRTHGVYAALGIVIAFNLLFTPNFATVTNVRLQLVQVTPIVVVALGMAVVVATAGIDLSVGATMALAAATLAATIDRGPAIAIAIALLVGVLAGLFNGVLVGVVRIQPIVATLGLFIAGRGFALMIADGRLTEIFDPTIRSIGTKRLVGGFQAGVFVALSLTVIIGVLARYTVFGKRVVAIGGSPDAARTAGLPVRPSLIFVYALSGGLAAVAGVLATARSGAADPSFVGLLIELSAITAVVVGGTPLAGGEIRVMGTVAGALLMQLIFATLIRHDLSDADARMVQALIIVAAVYIQRGRLR
ncbi:MAG: ABC transporter permease [Actinomycetota bacterium]|nr:ABC transporter permease [Actinomycetota bacterium]